MTSFLILLLVISSSSSTLALFGVLSLDAAWASTAVWRPQGEVDVFLAVQPNHEGGDVHHLLAHTAKIQRDNDFRKTFKFLKTFYMICTVLPKIGVQESN